MGGCCCCCCSARASDSDRAPVRIYMWRSQALKSKLTGSSPQKWTNLSRAKKVPLRIRLMRRRMFVQYVLKNTTKKIHVRSPSASIISISVAYSNGWRGARHAQSVTR
ncbi:putative E3 ubiquitin-protein ligase RHB1A [Zea mays]|uniref:Putative E3 ubiquitin-protein ligase RHB1A n=1 Tax=Zea mays TaxID=4577 RepID=A0A1D6HPU9_MAIZE|nr:putative E3 ubiquitin-protein ligase RHB1A [Zea mays]